MLLLFQTATLDNVSEMVRYGEWEGVSGQFQTSFGPGTRLSQLQIFDCVLESQNGRFGNQKTQGELGERKLFPPKENVTK